MKTYNVKERAIAKTLDTFPRVKRVAKKAYQTINYLYHHEKGFQLDLHPEVSLLRPEEFSQVKLGHSEMFFGYYDKSSWSPNMDQIVLHKLNSYSCVDIVIFNKGSKSCQTIAQSTTWNYQQGSMAQWLPESNGKKVVFNDVVQNMLSARILSVDNGKEKVINWPIQAIHPSGKKALTLNYKRLDRIRPEYGYSPPVGNFSENQPLNQDGIWKVDLDSGNGSLIISLAELIEHIPREEMLNSEHKVNHILYSPSGKRFVFLHRWVSVKGKFSRLYVADESGKDLRLLMDDRMVSHYNWQDDENLIVWGRTEKAGDRYYLINVTTGDWAVLGEGVLDKYGDGHPSFSPDKRWIITDTYPDKARQRHLLLYNVQQREIITLGRFLAPLKFDGAFRCDLHPRWSPDGKWISIDSAHEGIRLNYLLDLSAIVGK